jgi:hypothetical protein
MNTNLRTSRTVVDAWPVLVAFALYAIAFYIFAVMMTSGCLVA